MENRFGFLGLVIVALGALFGVAFVTRPAAVAAPAATPGRVAVASVSAVCPDPAGTRVSAITPPGGKGVGVATVTEVSPATVAQDGATAGGSGAPAGTSGAKPAGSGGKPAGQVTLDQPGRLWQRELPVRAAPVEIYGTGAMAAGLEAAQTRREKDGAARGLASVRCAEPGASTWFVGPGPAAADVMLYLTNADTAQAVVTIMAYAGEGPVVGDSGNSLVLKPGEHRAIRMRDLAPSPLVMAVEVRTVSGRVAASARAVLGAGKGADWLPVSAAPATSVVIPGIPGGGGPRELFVTAPGESDTVVRIKALTADGFYAMKNRESLDVPAGSTASLDVTTGIGGQPSALVLTADVPIVAGLMATGTGAKQDVAFSAGSPPIDVGSVVADNRTGKKVSSRLILSAPAAAGKVSVQVVPAKGVAPAPVEVDIPAARTREVKPAVPAGRGDFSLIVLPLPGSGPVYGGRVLDEKAPDGLYLTTQPLAQARTSALVPPIAESTAVVVP
ncbi:hypothetical protein Ssi03_07250 [Sphaerisporangium siamense]|uniref:Secreted protein n=1 Tax=Sphaerisporangium siamense TaxID=795645 RepID=A0A7W7DFW2_9ACTN|nr:DUF5719 family protein [Sphaerisporangium siamense]MBB4705871.1 hypothetical protein [Sphaerisporangium siamense]GII82735.1 hypothetical protein Ssi03_07250 [Sphaerisporangium siamense]